jgi:hypothetical protein
MYGDHNVRLIEKIANGINNEYRQLIVTNNYGSQACLANNKNSAVTFASQFYDLLTRNFLLSMRNRTFLGLRMFMHISVGVLLGAIYYDVGNDAANILNVFRLIFVALSFLTYTSYYSLVVVFPIDYPWIKRETFNRWYSITKWFLVTIICDLPVLIIGNLLFLIPFYYMTSLAPFEAFRIFGFTLIMMLNSFASMSFGLIASSFMGLKVS